MEASRYGGVFRMNLTEDFRSLYPPSIVEMQSRHIASQVGINVQNYHINGLDVRDLSEVWLEK